MTDSQTIQEYTAQWQRWVAENVIRGAQRDDIIAAMVELGIDQEKAERTVDHALAHPYVQGAQAAILGGLTEHAVAAAQAAA